MVSELRTLILLNWQVAHQSAVISKKIILSSLTCWSISTVKKFSQSSSFALDYWFWNNCKDDEKKINITTTIVMIFLNRGIILR